MRPIVSQWVGGAAVDRLADAALGEPMWGPSELLADLELRLGVAPLEVSASERVDAFLTLLDALVGRGLFFERSLRVDREGTASVLADLRNALWMAGWEGQNIAGGGPRIEALSAIEAERAARPIPFALGTADRIRAVARALDDARSPPYASLRLFDERALSPTLWKRVFTRLEALGAVVECLDPTNQVSNADSDTDLSRTQAIVAHAAPCAANPWKGDGSVVWLRARTGWELGEALVGLLINEGHADTLVVASGDTAALDAALSLQGLPTLGARTSTTLRPPLQVLSLSLAMVFGPRDPIAAIDLLTLPSGPFQGRMARELAGALASEPGIGGRSWRAAKEEIATPTDPGDADEAKKISSHLARIAAWVEGPAFDRAQGAPKEALVKMTRHVRTWVQGRLQMDDGHLWGDLHAASLELERMLGLDSRDALRPHEVETLVARALGSGMSARSTPEQAGRMEHVSSPHGVHRSHETVVVWHAGADPSTEWKRSPIRPGELRALARAGIDVVPDERRMEADARAWRRVLGATRRRFIVATPEASLGTPQLALPLWDEIAARCRADRPDLGRVTREASDVLRGSSGRAYPALALPAPRRHWTVPAELLGTAAAGIAAWSPTSLGMLLGCPLRLVLDRLANIKAGDLASVPASVLLYGSLGHRLAEDLFARDALGSTVRTESEVDSVLDTLIETEAATLLLPGMANELTQVREQLRRAMVQLSRLIEESGYRVLAVEAETQAPWGITALHGRVDLLLTNDAGEHAILDLKWGTSHYRSALNDGTALQLAMYTETHRRAAGTANAPPAAFFGLKQGRAIQLDGGPFRGAHSVSGPSLEATWDRAAHTTEAVLASLRSGRVPVTGVAGGTPLLELLNVPEKSRPRHYDPDPESACSYCDQAALCGRQWEGVR